MTTFVSIDDTPIGPTIPNTGNFTTLAVGGTGPITGFGMGIGQAALFANRGGRPSYELNGQWIINQAAPGPTVGADIFLRHDGSSVTTGSVSNINKLLQLTQTVGGTDPNTNWSMLINTSTSNTLGAKVLPAYFQMWRNAGSNAWIWGQVTEVHDFTGLASSAVGNPTLCQEWDLIASGADDAANPGKFGGVGNRHLAHFVTGRDSGSVPAEISVGLWFGTSNTSYIDSVIGFETASGGSMIRQALDTRGAIPPTGSPDPVASVRMSSGQIIDFNGGPSLSSAPGNYLQYTTSGTARLRYMVGATERWSIDNSGNMLLAADPTAALGAATKHYVDANIVNGPTGNVIATGSTATRTLQDRFGDWLNVKDFGAKLDGVALDTAAFNAARAAAKDGQTIYVPPGFYKVGALTPDTSKQVRWMVDGVTFPGGGNVPTMGPANSGDLLESFFSNGGAAGTKYLGKRSNPVAAAPLLRLDYIQDAAGGTANNIGSPLIVNSTTNADSLNSLWGICSVGDNYATDPTNGGMVGIQSTVRKHAAANVQAIQCVALDDTHLPSSANGGRGFVSIELAQRAHNIDDAPNAAMYGGIGNRIAMHVSQTIQDATVDIETNFSYGIWASTDATAHLYTKSMFGVAMNTQTYQVFDSRGAIPPYISSNPLASLRMLAGHIVDFNGGPSLSSGPGNYLQYTTTGTPRLRYMVGATERWSIDNNGGMILGADPTTALGAATKHYVDANIVSGPSGNVIATGSTTARTLQDRFADWLNIRDFGAKIDGTTVDTAAVNAALRAASANDTIWFPNGSGNMSFVWGGVTGGPQTPLLWKIDGTLSGGSRINRAFSRNNIGDMFENYYAGCKFLSVMSAMPDQPPILNLEYAFNIAGGTGGAIHTPLRITAQDNAGAVTSLWGIHVDMASYSDVVGTWPQQVGVSSSLLKYGHAWCAGMHITAADMQNQPSSTGGTMLGFELGMHANGPDDGGLSGSPGLRYGIHLGQSAQVPASAGGIVPAEFAIGYQLDGTNDSVTKSCFAVTGIQTYQVFDARTATAPPGYTDPVAALRMDPGQIVDFCGANTVLNTPGWKGPAGKYLQYITTGTPRLRYMVGATELFSIADTGAVTLKADPTTALGAATKQYVDSKFGGGTLSLTGGTITGALTVTGTTTIGSNTNASTFLIINGPAATQRRLQWNTAGVARWIIYANPTAETGTNNAGTDLDLFACTDAGASSGVVTRWTRSTGSVTLDPAKLYTTGIFTSNLAAAFTKQMTLRGNYALTGAAGSPNSMFWSDSTLTGTADATVAGYYELNRLNVTDTALTGATYTRRALLSLRYVSGTGASGVSYALLCRAGDAGIGTDRSHGQPYQAAAGMFNTTNAKNQGGTSLTDPSGSAWGLQVVGLLSNGATFYEGLRGVEIDIGINAGASAASKTGLKIVQQNDKVDAVNGGQFILLGRDINSNVSLDGINFGSRSDVGWSWSTNTRLLNASGYGNDYVGQSLKALYGFDAYAVDFSGAFLRSYGTFGPFIADGSGVQIGSMRFTPSATGLTIDATGAYGTGIPVIAVAGAGYQIGDLLFYGTGGVARVTAITTDGTGGVSTITVSRQPYITTGSPPANSLATTVDYRSVGTGCTLTQTWNTNANTLTLNPSGTLSIPNLTTKKITQTLSVTDPVATAGDHGYAIDQAISFNPGPNAKGIYFGNKMGCVIYGSQARNDAQIWNNLDQMICVSDPTSSADYVNRYIQSVRFNGAGQSQMWCAVMECSDRSGLKSSQSGTMVALEVDIVADDEDDAMARQGIAICMLTGANPKTKPPMTFRNALSIWTGYGMDATKNAGVIRMFELNCPFREAGLDFRWSLPMTGTTGNALWLRAAHKVVFNNTGTAYLQALNESASQINTSGNLAVAGAITATSNITAGAGVTVTGNVTATGNVIAAGSFAAGAGYSVSQANANGYFSADTTNAYLCMADGYRWVYQRSSGAMYWQNRTGAFIEGFAPNIHWFCSDGNFALGNNPGQNRYHSYGSGWYWLWDQTNGNMYWATPAGIFLGMRLSDKLIWNQLGPLGAYGPCYNFCDEKFKEDVQEANHGLKHVLGLKPKSFKRKKKLGKKLDAKLSAHPADVPGAKEYTTETGFVAQDVQKVLPQAVIEMDDPDGGTMLAISPETIIAALVNAVKELNAKVEALSRDKV